MSGFHPQKYVSFGDNKTPNITTISGCNIGCRFCKCLIVKLIGGKTGIRTLGARKDSTVFETVPIDHSGIFPYVGAKLAIFFVEASVSVEIFAIFAFS